MQTIVFDHYENASVPGDGPNGGAVFGWDPNLKMTAELSAFPSCPLNADGTVKTGFTLIPVWPIPPTAADKWAAYQQSAKAALAASDVTVTRTSEAVALGNTTWAAADVVAYMQMRAALRAILSQPQPSTIPTSLPTAPHPKGT